MAIINLQISTIRRIPYGTHQKLLVGLGNLVPEQILGFVPCQPLSENPCFQEGQCMPVFATVAGILERENDKSAFLFEMPGTAPHSSFKLQKYNHATETFVEVATLDSNTYGTFYNTGSLVPYFSYSGYLIDWQKVLNIFGAGHYRFVVQAKDGANPPFDYLFSYVFDLQIFSCDAADRTFFVEHTFKNEIRNILKQVYDTRIEYFELSLLAGGWYDRCRYYGMVGQEEYETTATFVKPADRSNRHVYSTNVIKMDLQFETNISEILRRVLMYGMNGNVIYITDTNSKNTKAYEKIQVILDSNTKPNYSAYSKFAFNMIIKVKNAYDITSTSGGFV